MPKSNKATHTVTTRDSVIPPVNFKVSIPPRNAATPAKQQKSGT